jgi:putative salt-induced outer membrane protein YdiY
MNVKRHRRRVGARPFGAIVMIAPLLLLLVVTALPLQAQRRDVVTMKNGDQLSGEIKKLEQGQLFIETPYAVDPIPVDWLQVDRLESAAEYQVELDQGQRLVGTIAKVTPESETAQDFQVKNERAETGFRASEVIGIQSQNDNFWRQIRGSIDFGFSFNSGSEQTQENVSASATYPSTRFRLDARLNSSLTSTGDTGKTDRHEISTGAQFYLSRHSFVGVIGSFLTSSQQSLDLRTTVGGGFGRYIIRSNRAELAWLAGAVYTTESYDPSAGTDNNKQIAEGLLGLGYEWSRFDTAEFQTVFRVYPGISDTDRVRSDLNLSFLFKLKHGLYLKFNLWNTFDSKPPVNARKNELGVSNSFGKSF